MLWSDLGWGSQAYTWWVQFNVEWVLAQIKSWVGQKKKNVFGAYLMVHWLGIHLAIQGTLVQSLAWEDPTCQDATKPVHN